MGRLKVGKIHTEAICITCPYCGGYIENRRDGSFMFIDVDIYEMEDHSVRECAACGKSFRIPVDAINRLRGS